MANTVMVLLNYTYNYTWDMIATRESMLFLAGFIPLIAMYYLYFVRKKHVLGAFISVSLMAYFLLMLSSRIIIPVGQYVVNNTIYYYYRENPFYTLYLAGFIMSMVPLLLFVVEKIIRILGRL